MISPVQMQSFDLVESHFSANPAYQLSEEGGTLKPTFYVRGQRVSPDSPPETSEEKTIVQIDLSTERLSRSEPKGGTEQFDIFLYVGINTVSEAVQETMPYQIETVTLGRFSANDVPPATEEEERGRVLDIIRVNGASMLYGGLRRIIQRQTTSHRYPFLLLPGINLREVVEWEKTHDVEGPLPAPNP